MKRINPEKVWRSAAFSHATTNGTIMVLSGQTGRDVNGNIVSDSFVDQARQALVNIKNIVESQGKTMDDVMKITGYLKDLKYGKEYHKVRDEFFKPDKRPASTTVGVTALWDERLLIEIEAIVDMT